ncbi:MAG: complex I subunit 1/NuoH family protein [Candidatus Limnocylindrales bacterium]
MTVISRPWNRLSTAGKIVLPLAFVLIALTVLLLVGVAVGVVPNLVSWIAAALDDNVAIVRFVVAVTAVLLFTVPTAFVIIYLEMKVIALLALRLGPNRQGPWGVLASTLHGFKVLAKEDFTPTGADVPAYTLAPAAVYLAAVMTFLVIPFAPGLVAQDMNLGLLYIFAVGGLGVVGLMMAGWSSFNKYSLLGALRAAAQIISYEIPLTLSVVGVIMLAGTLSLNRIVEQQSGSFLDWYVFRQPLAAVIFFVAAIAEGNRTPFDMTEADSEIVAGFATEYSGMRFGFFFFAEYVNVFVLSALTVTLFLGGWNAPLDLRPVEQALGLNLGSVDLAALGIALPFLLLLVPAIATVLLALPFWMLFSRLRFWQALIAGFLAFNALVVGGVLLWAAFNFEAVMGLFWFMLKSYTFVVIFVFLRGTLPRLRVDQLMGFAWKWLLPAALLNLFVTALAVLLVQQVRP